MANKDKTDFTGKIRNLVFYNWKNKKCIRTIPTTVRQTDATKRLATLFGKAVTISKFIRASLIDVVPDHKESGMRLRFNNAIYQWLRFYKPGEPSDALHFINRFSFTSKPLPVTLKKKLNLDWSDEKLRITLSAMDLPSDLPAPKGTKSVVLKFVLTACNIERLKPVVAKSEMIELHNQNSTAAETCVEFNFSTETGTLFILVLSVKYNVSKDGEIYFSEFQKWMVAGVVGSYYFPVSSV